MNKKSRKELLVTVAITTSLIFSLNGCGMFKSCKTAETGKASVSEEQQAVDKKAATAQSKDKDVQGQTKETAAAPSEINKGQAKKTATDKSMGKKCAAGDVYVVKKGDSLWKIAKASYNNPLKWRVIYNANKKKIKDPNRIYPKQRFIIPEVK
jgi:nucleoid-associated protein YgaU